MKTRSIFTIFTIFSWAVSATTAIAQDVSVQASDFRGGSRIEIQLGSMPFSVEPAGPRAIDVIAPNGSVEFDIDQIIQGRFASRVETARLSRTERGTRLRLLLNCDCGFATFVTNGTLSLEIRDPLRVTLPDQQDDEIADVPETRVRRFSSNFAPVRSPIPAARITAGANPSRTGTLASQTSQGSETATDASSRAAEINLARQRLVEQLAKAAEQGLLEYATAESEQLFAGTSPPSLLPDLSIEEPDLEVSNTTPPAQKIPQPAPKPEPQRLVMENETTLVELPVRARTARDKAFRRDRLETIIPSYKCLDDLSFNLNTRNQDRDFLTLAGDHRRRLINTFDEPDPKIVEELARLYLSAGFGAEVIHLMKAFGAEVKDRDLLTDIALIVDGHTPLVTGAVAKNGQCSALSLLWFTLAGFQMENGAIERLSATGRQLLGPDQRNREIVEQFAGQSPILRQVLGPKLMHHALDNGDATLAQLVDQILRRMAIPVSAELDLARARLLASGGEVASAEAMYQRLALATVPSAQNALLLLLDSQIARGARPSVALADALSDAAFLARGSMFERRLKVAEIRARAIAEGLDAALNGVTDALKRNPDSKPLLVDTAHAVFEDAVANSDEPLSFARAVLRHSHLISTASDGDFARSQVARQLTGIGLANAALEMLEPAAERKLPYYSSALAEAYVALGDGVSALSALDGIDNAAASEIRTRAYLLTNQPENALAEIAEYADVPADEMAKLALRAGNWRQASAAGPKADRLLAAYMAGTDRTDGDAAGPSGPEVSRNPIDDLLGDLEESAQVSRNAILRPPTVGEAVTLDDARNVMSSSQTVRNLIEEIFEDG